MALLLVAYSITLALSLYVISSIISTRRQLPLPPGPKGLPLVGNIADLPPPGMPEWQHWLKHRELYGPLSSVTVMGQTIILIHDKEVAVELFEKQAVKYSSRPSMVFGAEMVGYGITMSFRPYDKPLREQRKLAALQLGTKNALGRFHPSIDLQVRRFLLRTLNRPNDLDANLKTLAGSVMLHMLYGYTPSPHAFDPLVALINKMMSEFSQATVAGVWLVDSIPWLRYLPEYLPGMGFKQTAREWNKTLVDVTDAPVDFVKQQMTQNTAKPSYISGLLGDSDREIPREELDFIKHSALSLYGGGADTTVSALRYFFLVMTLFPEVQRKAREEIDRVIGTDRLPSFGDRDKLTYVEAVLKETLRGHPIVPLAVPRAVEAEDQFQGYRIPKGGLLLPSIAWFARDPAVYHEPETFKPERFLEPYNEPSPRSFIFGFGRRICPGRLLADSSLFLTITQSLAVFDIKKDLDKNGREIEPAVGLTPGIISHPVEFQYRFVPRSEKHVKLIRSVEMEHPWEEGDAKFLDEWRTQGPTTRS